MGTFSFDDSHVVSDAEVEDQIQKQEAEDRDQIDRIEKKQKDIEKQIETNQIKLESLISQVLEREMITQDQYDKILNLLIEYGKKKGWYPNTSS